MFLCVTVHAVSPNLTASIVVILTAIIARVNLAAVAAAAIIAAIIVHVAATVVIAVTVGGGWWKVNLHSLQERRQKRELKLKRPRKRNTTKDIASV